MMMKQKRTKEYRFHSFQQAFRYAKLLIHDIVLRQSANSVAIII